MLPVSFRLNTGTEHMTNALAMKMDSGARLKLIHPVITFTAIGAHVDLNA